MQLLDYLGTEPATLQQILDRREARAAAQQALLQSGGRALISVSMNITGAYKRFPLASMGLLEGVRQLRQALGAAVLHCTTHNQVTGCEALLLLDLAPSRAKEICLELEQNHPLGRLFDFDVLTPAGEILTRQALGFAPRRCLLCEQDAKLCARSEAHPREALLEHTVFLLRDFFRDRAAERLSDIALRAALYEVATTPKPGLVDRVSCGAHSDMDFFSFLDSAIALRPFFAEAYRVGFDLGEEGFETLFTALQQTGLAADRAMFSATGGVNTHQGLVFSVSILCGSLGRATRLGQGLPRSDKAVFSCATALGQIACGTPLADVAILPQGFGARGEAASGFSTVRKIALPAIVRHRRAGCSLNDAAALCLIELIAKTSDTNMIRRGGAEKAEACRAQCAALLENISADTAYQALLALDQQYIKENLSPGGCADLLAMGLLLYFLIEKGELSSETAM